MDLLPSCGSFSYGSYSGSYSDFSLSCSPMAAPQKSLFAEVILGAGPVCDRVPVKPPTLNDKYRDAWDRLASFSERTHKFLPPFLVNPVFTPDQQRDEVQRIMDSLYSWSHIPLWGCYSSAVTDDVWVINDRPSSRITEAIGNVVKLTEFILHRLESNNDPRYIIRHLPRFTEYMEAIRAFHSVAIEVNAYLERIATALPPNPLDFAEKASKAFGVELARHLSMGCSLEDAMKCAQWAAWGAFPEKLRE